MDRSAHFKGIRIFTISILMTIKGSAVVVISIGSSIVDIATRHAIVVATTRNRVLRPD